MAEITSLNRSQIYWNIIKKNKKNIINLNNKINNIFLAIISILNNNIEIMRICYYEIKSISKKYPPQKNENKFIYGKLIEIAIITALKKIGIKCYNLDENHLIGSEYKNDLHIFNINVSIKAKLNRAGNIILINKKSTNIHDLKIETIVCSINEGKLYFISSKNVNTDKYIFQDPGTISYRSSLITFYNKIYKDYIYYFPQLNELFNQKLTQNIELDIYNILYNDTIKFIE